MVLPPCRMVRRCAAFCGAAPHPPLSLLELLVSADAPEWSPPRAQSAAARRYWAAQYFLRRVVFLALIFWCAVSCVLQLSGPRWEAALAGLVCSGVVLWVQGGWVWRRYRRWVT